MSAEDDSLLAMAAKAEGRPPPYDQHGIFSAWVGDMVNGHWWNPLEDDGDALRLALKTGLSIEVIPAHDSVMAHIDNQEFSVSIIEALDNYGARRAIVRAAAEIGRKMP